MLTSNDLSNAPCSRSTASSALSRPSSSRITRRRSAVRVSRRRRLDELDDVEGAEVLVEPRTDDSSISGSPAARRGSHRRR